MSSEFRVRIQVTPTAYKTLPMDGELAHELAEAVHEVREAVTAENISRNLIRDKQGLDNHQRCINHRREMEERAVELFRTMLSGIPEYLAENPYLPSTGGHHRPRKEKAA